MGKGNRHKQMRSELRKQERQGKPHGYSKPNATVAGTGHKPSERYQRASQGK